MHLNDWMCTERSGISQGNENTTLYGLSIPEKPDAHLSGLRGISCSQVPITKFLLLGCSNDVK